MTNTGRQKPADAWAIALFAGGLSIGSVHAGLAKGLSAELPVLMIAWGRYLAFLITISSISFTIYGISTIRPTRPILQWVRGIAFVTSATCTIAALQGLPLADTIAILFVYPFVATALSPWLLKERLQAAHWISITVGFIGVLVVMRPSVDGVSIHALLALCSGLAFGIQLVVTRQLSGSSHPVVTATYTAAIGTIVLSCIIPWAWTPLNTSQLQTLGLIGIIAAAGQFMVIKACDRADASALAPFGYLEIIGAAFVGLLMFSDWPDQLTFTGIGIIIFSGVYMATATRR